MDDAGKQRKEVENQLASLARQIESMDNKIRAYLADRQRNPNPRYGELVERIQKFRINPAITNKYLETMLDSLQWKVYHQSRAWRQQWENAEVKRKNDRKTAISATSPENFADKDTGDANEKSVYSVDRLWELQKTKLKSLGEKEELEMKDEFVQRIKKRYGQLASGKEDNEEVYMKFDNVEKRCTLEIRKRTNT